MYVAETFIELPIAISPQTWEEGQLPVLYGFNYNIFIKIYSEKLNEKGMVIDFKDMNKIVHDYLDQYDHSMILTPDNPLVQLYKENYKKHGIDFDRSRVFVWLHHPTVEYMSQHFTEILTERFKDYGLQFHHLKVIVSENGYEKMTYEDEDQESEYDTKIKN